MKIPLMAEYEPKAYKDSALCNCIFAKFMQKIYPDSVVGIRVFSWVLFVDKGMYDIVFEGDFCHCAICHNDFFNDA